MLPYNDKHLGYGMVSWLWRLLPVFLGIAWEVFGDKGPWWLQVNIQSFRE